MAGIPSEGLEYVPVFFVKPHPDTVDSVTAAGIVGLFKITAAPVVAFQSDCTLETLLFQLVISEEVIPAAADAVNTGSVSVYD